MYETEPGEHIGKREVIWRKQCECQGKSSGPRVVIVDGSRLGAVTFRFVWLACDVCDKEWAFIDE